MTNKVCPTLPTAMQTNITKIAHRRRHFSSNKTLTVLRENNHIPTVNEKVDRCFSNCIKRILIKRKICTQDSLLNSIPKDETLYLTHRSFRFIRNHQLKIQVYFCHNRFIYRIYKVVPHKINWCCESHLEVKLSKIHLWKSCSYHFR